MNVNSTLCLLNVMSKFSCYKLIFSSSATVYGNKKPQILKEDSEIMPAKIYGKTKAYAEKILLNKYNKKKDWKIINLRYFNPIGAHESGMIGEDSKSESTNIFPLINRVALGKINKLKIFGNDWETNDGTANLRSLIHADGKIRYANYQREDQMSEYLTAQGHDSVIAEILQG